MKKLELNQMENLEGGLNRECTMALIGAGLAAAGALSLTAATAGVGAATFWAVGALFTAISGQGACHGQL